MDSDTWLADTRRSYDTVADSYHEVVRDMLAQTPYERAALDLFAAQVRKLGGGPVVEVGCGPGRIAGYLHGSGIEVSGLDLSPAMIEIAHREHPDLRFEVGSMTDLDLPDASLAGVVAWYSLIHVPDAEIPSVLARFRQALRPSAPLLVAFHAGNETTLKTEGYGGHPMHVHVHRRLPEQVAESLEQAGFTVEATMRLRSAESRDGAIVFARRAD
ncbi:class I SAM-dependent methyltransferase [Catellatospora sp. KI3]|uniref:class I SAM-dependent DNA methyltransferase n=1 Tax=Catellatospora sp. KI3 TaxID=3041620 RepID=UPI002482670B|nr:class I SAM-dependent methyltransferase [Catellatospora sp. KI3]MDI1461285.1 class I SAM-dependent methyltransferase [Catellatospora sp. KI3]